MAVELPVRSTEEAKAAGTLRAGGAIGVASALLALALPWVLLVGSSAATRLFVLNLSLLHAVGALALAGSLGVLVTFLLYRRAFTRLRHADPRLRAAVLLCRLGSIGTVALLAVFAWLLGGPGSLVRCLSGDPSDVYVCVRSSAPEVAWVAVTGFWLVWAGGVGVVVGLRLAGRHYRAETLGAAAALYGALLVLLLLPFVSLVYLLHGATYTGLVAALAGVAAPALVWQGARVRSGHPAPSAG